VIRGRLMAFRILLFSMLAALVLYLPFYYFAPFYRELYAHVDMHTVNWWYRIAFREHNGIQAYIAYALMFLAIGLTASFEYMYVRFLSGRARWLALGLVAAAGCYYLWLIGFCPPMADISLNGQGVFFIIAAVTTAFMAGCFFERRWVKVFLLFLLICICMVPPVWTNLPTDYFYILAPALRTLKGYALNQSYFQYDHLFCPLAMLWMKLNLPLDRFHVVGEFFYVVFFIGVYLLARNLFVNKQLAFYFVFSLVLIKIYCNLTDTTMCPQETPLRMDLWLVVAAMAFWKGPWHWLVGLTLGFLLIFHHAFGMIYSIAYILLVLTILAFKISKDSWRQYFPNACMMLGGELINMLFISSQRAPALSMLKYNLTFMPLVPKSFFWYVPVVMSAAVLLIWKSRSQLPQRYFQTGVFLVFLAIGNLIYFFGRSHENNLINVSASLWLVFFMLMDLVVFRLPQKYADLAKKIIVPLAGVLIVGGIAYFYSHRTVDRITQQLANLPKIGELFQPDKGVNIDLDMVKLATGGNPNVVFLSIWYDLDYYYRGGYTPAEICPLETQIFIKDLLITLDNKLAKGGVIIIPKNEFAAMIETVLMLKANDVYKISDFVYISNNQPLL